MGAVYSKIRGAWACILRAGAVAWPWYGVAGIALLE